MKNTITETLKILIASVLFTLSVGYVFAANHDLLGNDWSPPTVLPPGNNTKAPVNVGATTQTKFGNFSVAEELDNFGVPTGIGGVFSAKRSFFGDMRIGLPVITPAEALDVSGNIVASGSICSAIDGCIGDGGGGLWTASGGDVYRSAGNVGIGTATPQASLSIEDGSDTGSLRIKSNLITYTQNIFFAAARDIGSIGDDPFHINFGNNTGRLIKIGGEVKNGYTEQKTLDVRGDITATGRVGIGTLNPGFLGIAVKLDIDTGTGIDGGLRVGGNNLQPRLYINKQDGTLGFLVGSNGNVGIGVTVPQNKLDVAGTIKAHKIRLPATSFSGASLYASRTGCGSDSLIKAGIGTEGLVSLCVAF